MFSFTKGLLRQISLQCPTFHGLFTYSLQWRRNNNFMTTFCRSAVLGNWRRKPLKDISNHLYSRYSLTDGVSQSGSRDSSGGREAFVHEGVQ